MIARIFSDEIWERGVLASYPAKPLVVGKWILKERLAQSKND